MKILLVTAHPEIESFNFAARNRILEVLGRGGHEVEVSDLYQDGFRPSLGRSDFPAWRPGRALRVLAAQGEASRGASFSDDIAGEQRKLERCDVLIFQFPIWWGSYPAILKGWVDRVLAYGFAYGRDQRLSRKKVLYSVTTGGADDEVEEAAYRSRVDSLAEDVFGYMGWEVLPPLFSHGVAGLDEPGAELQLAAVEAGLVGRLNLGTSSGPRWSAP